jgi:Na+-transporting methylmalonyl-CoA/oxaloacetate decarboxylase gamma subunit
VAPSQTVFFILGLAALGILIWLLSLLSSNISHSDAKGTADPAEENDTADKLQYDTKRQQGVTAIANAIDAHRRGRQSQERDRSKREKITIAVLGATAIFALLAAIAAIASAWIFQGQLSEMHKSAEVSRRALEGVERPVLTITPPKYVAVPANQKILDPQRTTYAVIVENIGKQIATLFFGHAFFMVKQDPIPPIFHFITPETNNVCSFFILGQLAIKPNDTHAFVCQRMTELTTEEVTKMNDELLFGFFQAAFEYADPVGTIRASYCIFLLRPPVNVGEFIQIMCGDNVAHKEITEEEQTEAQRKLMGGFIEIQRDIDRREGKIPTPEEHH